MINTSLNHASQLNNKISRKQKNTVLKYDNKRRQNVENKQKNVDRLAINNTALRYVIQCTSQVPCI